MKAAFVGREPLPFDPKLPRLAQALDTEAMGSVFDDILRPHGRRTRACSVERIKYRPGRNASIVYRLRVQDDAGDEGVEHEQIVAARLCQGDGQQRLDKARQRPDHATASGPRLHFAPGLDLMSWWWPNDAKLLAPAVLDDRAAMNERWLPPLVAALSDGLGRLIDARVDIVQYVPEHRLTARVALGWQQDGRRISHTVYAKASRDPDAGTLHAGLLALQSSPAARQGRLRTPRALLVQPEAQLLWLEALPGRAWSTLDEARRKRLAPALASQIAALHATPAPAGVTLDATLLRTRIDTAAAVVAQVLPGHVEAMSNLCSVLIAGLPTFARQAHATLHGDLHGANVLVDGDAVALIDLDDLARGAAALDLGGWLAEELAQTLSCHPDAVVNSETIHRHELVLAYARSLGTPIDRQALAWATAWSLLTQRALRCVINLKPGRLALAPRLLDLALQVASPACVSRMREHP